jgi:hypothetical protein
VTARVTGPFVSTGERRLPRFAFVATLAAAGRSERVGATWTGEKRFITLQNTSYALSELVAQQFAAGYEQGAARQRARRRRRRSQRAARRVSRPATSQLALIEQSE